MRTFNPALADIRFGYGLSPVVPTPARHADLLDGLLQDDVMAARFPIERYDLFRTRMVASQAAFKIYRKEPKTEAGKAAFKERRLIQKDARLAMVRWQANTFLRRSYSETPFRERLVAFWADHFTAFGKRGVERRAASPYAETAIRPFVTGSFGDLLQAAVMHPLMINYLDQTHSAGPNSTQAGRNKNPARGGLNENLAREVLELHTLGVGGPYTQADVTQLAELFTGMTFDTKKGLKYRKDYAEPGAETVLDVTYSDKMSFDPIRKVLSDLAVHPATARHVAEKLARHFVHDTPDPDLVDAVEAAYLGSDGDLMKVYAALLDHPSAWARALHNFKPPIDYVSSALRALAVPPDALYALDERTARSHFFTTLLRMGQEWERPGGPDGWPEEDGHWATPQGLSTRVAWAMTVPEAVLETLPDPRVFVDTALGPYADDAVRFAAGAAESKSEGIGLILSAPAFQRR